MDLDLAQLKAYVHRQVDALPKPKLHALSTFISTFAEPPSLAESLASAPFDDEELLPEFAASLERAYASAEKGNVTSHEDILREFSQ